MFCWRRRRRFASADAGCSSTPGPNCVDGGSLSAGTAAAVAARMATLPGAICDICFRGPAQTLKQIMFQDTGSQQISSLSNWPDWEAIVVTDAPAGKPEACNAPSCPAARPTGGVHAMALEHSNPMTMDPSELPAVTDNSTTRRLSNNTLCSNAGALPSPDWNLYGLREASSVNGFSSTLASSDICRPTNPAPPHHRRSCTSSTFGASSSSAPPDWPRYDEVASNDRSGAQANYGFADKRALEWVESLGPAMGVGSGEAHVDDTLSGAGTFHTNPAHVYMNSHATQGSANIQIVGNPVSLVPHPASRQGLSQEQLQQQQWLSRSVPQSLWQVSSEDMELEARLRAAVAEASGGAALPSLQPASQGSKPMADTTALQLAAAAAAVPPLPCGPAVTARDLLTGAAPSQRPHRRVYASYSQGTMGHATVAVYAARHSHSVSHPPPPGPYALDSASSATVSDATHKRTLSVDEYCPSQPQMEQPSTAPGGARQPPAPTSQLGQCMRQHNPRHSSIGKEQTLDSVGFKPVTCTAQALCAAASVAMAAHAAEHAPPPAHRSVAGGRCASGQSSPSTQSLPRPSSSAYTALPQLPPGAPVPQLWHHFAREQQLLDDAAAAMALQHPRHTNVEGGGYDESGVGGCSERDSCGSFNSQGERLMLHNAVFSSVVL